MNNPQVTKASNSLVGTSEAIRMLNLNTNVKFFHNKNFEYKYYTNCDKMKRRYA